MRPPRGSLFPAFPPDFIFRSLPPFKRFLPSSSSRMVGRRMRHSFFFFFPNFFSGGFHSLQHSLLQLLLLGMSPTVFPRPPLPAPSRFPLPLCPYAHVTTLSEDFSLASVFEYHLRLIYFPPLSFSLCIPLFVFPLFVSR